MAVFNGSSGNDVYNGSNGDDQAYGNGGNDTLKGNDGSDRIQGNAGADILFGGTGQDFLASSTADDVDYWPAAQSLDAGTEIDSLSGGDGDDFMEAGFGDTVDGGAGYDTLYLDGDYSGGLWLGANTVTNIENWYFASGHSYNITVKDGNNQGNNNISINASNLGASEVITFNATAETSNGYTVTGGAGSRETTSAAFAFASVTTSARANGTPARMTVAARSPIHARVW